eukprot:354691_1
MALLDSPNPSLHLLRNIINVIAMIHNLVILTYHSYYSFECITKLKTKRLQHLSLFTIAILTLLSVYYAITPFIIATDTICGLLVLAGASLWVLTKITMYFFFLERLFLIFMDSTYAFSSCKMIGSRIVLITYATFCLTILIIFMHGKVDPMTHTCLATSPMWVNAIGVIGDYLICTLMQVAVSRRLLLLIMNSKTQNKAINVSNDLIIRILTKSTILTFIALLSTELSLLLMGSIGLTTLWVSLDSMINCWCVFTMFAVHKKLYLNICGKLESIISYKCLLCCSCHCCYMVNITEVENPTIQRVGSISIVSATSVDGNISIQEKQKQQDIDKDKN